MDGKDFRDDLLTFFACHAHPFRDTARPAIVHTALGPPKASSTTAGETTATVVFVLARHPYTSAFAAICEHIGELIWEEVRRPSVSLALRPERIEHQGRKNVAVRMLRTSHTIVVETIEIPTGARFRKQQGLALQDGDFMFRSDTRWHDVSIFCTKAFCIARVERSPSCEVVVVHLMTFRYPSGGPWRSGRWTWSTSGMRRLSFA